MTASQFVVNNISMKKLSWGKRDGYIKIQLFDNTYTKIWDSKANLNNKNDVKRLLKELENKGCNVFRESSWW